MAEPSRAWPASSAMRRKRARCRSRTSVDSPLAISRSRPYWRIVSSIRKLVPPPWSATTSERSTSRPRPSRVASRAAAGVDDPPSVAGSAVTSAAASSVQPPAKTERRRRSRWSGSLSRSQLQSMSAWSVCWRGTDVRRPPVRRRNRSFRPWAMSCARQHVDPRRGELERERDAVEPPADLDHRLHARGIEPERRLRRRRPIDEQADGLGRGRPPRGRPGRARPGCASDGTWNSASPGTPSPSRLVASTRSDAAAAEQPLREVGGRPDEVLAVVEEQQEVLLAQEVRHRPRSPAGPASRGCRAPARPPAGTRLGIAQRRELDQPRPVGEPAGDAHPRPGASAASCPCRRRRRATRGGWRASSASISATSRSRPMNEVSWAGRFDGALPERSGGKSDGRPGRDELVHVLRAAEVLEAMVAPVEQRRMPGGRSSARIAAPAAETRTWPPWPIASSRATRLRAGPKKSPSRVSAEPEWMAIRTRSGVRRRPRVVQERALAGHARPEGGRRARRRPRACRRRSS